jgi:uncharacterized membrane protein
MNLDLTMVVNLVLVWVIIATSLTYFLVRNRAKSTASTVIFNFFLAFIPPVSLLSLLFLASKKENES